MPQPTWEDLQERFATASVHAESKAHGAMLLRHGDGPNGKHCGDCALLNTNGRYFKCRAYRESRSSTSDWRKKWRACGHFFQRPRIVSRNERIAVSGAEGAEGES